MPRLRAWLTEPLLHFLALGALLFLLYQQFADRGEPITLSDAGLAVLEADFRQLVGRDPTDTEQQRLVDEFYRAEVLFREALRRQLPATDPALREPIVERMQAQLSGGLQEPTSQQLVDFYAAHIDRYYREATISCRQYFLRTEPRAPEALRSQLAADAAPPGDRPRRGAEFPDYGESMLRALFGQPILDALRGAAIGDWVGPFATADGWHYFSVSGRRAAELLPFTAVREQVAADYRATQIEQRLDAFVDAKRSRYPLRRVAE
jgi:peptidyl-prolyl cis-trans isomerase C